MSTPSASVLVEPLDAYLERRARSAHALTAGESVTVAVGLLRGCRRTTGRFAGVRWWLRADGCPIAVEEDGDPDAVAATAAALERLATMASDDPTRELLTRARESVLTQPPRAWDALERRLFQHAAPLPLVLGPLTPVERPTSPEGAPPSGSGAGVLSFVDADLADAVGQALGDLRARWRSSRAVRLGAVATAAALVAVAAALAWPQPAVPEASAQGTPSAFDLVTVDAGGPATESPSPGVAPTVDTAPHDGETLEVSIAPTPDDPVASARSVLAELDRCAGEAACVASFAEDVDAVHDPLLPDTATAEVDLIDDFGGVIVVRLSRGAEMQYVTLARQKDRWLVRAVETVADQPS